MEIVAGLAKGMWNKFQESGGGRSPAVYDRPGQFRPVYLVPEKFYQRPNDLPGDTVQLRLFSMK